MLKHLLALSAVIFTGLNALTQLSVNNGLTATQLANNLAGYNINVSNATINNVDTTQYGNFSYTGTELGLNSGVILSTGSIFDAPGPNSNQGTSTSFGLPGDTDLSALAGFSTHDAVVFEFDFEVQGDEIEFNYVFLSEEYNEFVNSGFNDVFAFYISGPGITGMENLAVVPGTTTPVTINSINNNSFWQFYNDNDQGGTNIEYDGFTTLMTAKKSGLQQCGTYTLSLRIADGSDDQLDAAVLLQENSLVQTNVSASSSTFSANNIALEGCIEASFTFQLDTIATEDVYIPISFGGTALMGTDYSNIDNQVIIPQGQSSATIIIDAIADGITEGQEVIELYYSSSPCAPQDTVLLFIDDYIPLEYNITPTDITCAGAMDGQVDLSVSGGISPYYLTLTDSVTGAQTTYNNFPVIGLDAGTYYVDVIDGYGCTAEDIVAGNLFDAGQTFIPDGQGGSYSSTINLSGFGAGQTVTTVDQIQSICVTMEHSRIGELEIKLTAPDGTEIILKEQPGGSTCNMGEPCAIGPTDGGQNGTEPGIGYNYCWQNNPTYGTMVSESNNFTYTYINPCDGSSQSDKYLPSGSYEPYEPFTNLIGVPLNGNWQITVTDQIPNNNGYIFDWSISLQADLPDSIFTISEPEAPTFTHTTVQPDCGQNNGAVDITISNAITPLSYSWSNGTTTEDLTGVSAGTYTLNLTDGNGCVHTYQVDLSNNGSLVLSGIETNEVCAGNNDGAIDLTISGGSTPFNISWSNGSTIEDPSNLAPGNYTVTVNDAGSCSGIESFTILAASQIITNASITNEDCGDQEGIINLNINGGTAPFTYLWSNGDATEDINNLSQGTYSVELWDANSCYSTDTFIVSNLVGNCVPNCDLEITTSTTYDEGCGQSDGSIDLTLFTSNGPSQVNWSNGATTTDISSLSAGQYIVNITDVEGCEIIDTFNIQNLTNGLQITSIIGNNENCGDQQGSIDLSISGGVQPYIYSWSNGATTQDLTNLSAGTYSVTVTDNNGCSVNQSLTIDNNANGLAITYGNAVDEICGNSSGSIDIQVTSSAQPITYSWSNGATTQDLLNLSAGNYQCTITDGTGCSITSQVFTVNNQSGGLTISNINTDNEVCGNSMGEVVITVSGGATPYTFNWSNGATTQNIYNLSAGTYEGTVVDNNGCSVSTGNLTLVDESGTLALNQISVQNEVCNDGNGSVNITVSGGTSPISFAWNTGSNSEDLYGISAGSYNCVITDLNGCTVDASATVQNESGTISIDNIVVTNETCGQGNGALDALVSGGSSPLTYNWNSGQNTEDISNLTSGNYTLTVTDNFGCSQSQSTTVQNTTSGVQAELVQLTNEICSNSSGSVDINISGGTTPYTITWSNGATTEDLNGLSAGIYSVTITDNSGCSINLGPFTLNNTSSTLAVQSAVITDESCGNNSGSIDLTTTGGTTAYTYVWSNGATTEDISSLSAGTYTVTIDDANGCSITEDYIINNSPTTLSIDQFVITDESCGTLNGAVDISVSGGTMPYTYNWSNGATTEDISGIPAGTYDLVLSDVNGCQTAVQSYVVGANPGNLNLNGINVIDEECGNGAGNIDVIISGNTGSLTYTWSNGATSEDLNNISAGTYSGTATDVTGCSVNFSAVVQNTSGSLTVSSSNTDITCVGTTGAIDLNLNGGTLPATYIWSNGATSEDLSNITAGQYTCFVTDANGCTATYQTQINDFGSVEIQNISAIDETCGNSDGAITISTTGGQGPYVYSWTPNTIQGCCSYIIDYGTQGPGGWNGATLDVSVNGTLLTTLTHTGGPDDSYAVPVCTGDNIELSYTSPGGFPGQIQAQMSDASGATVFNLNPFAQDGIVYAGTANCPSSSLNGNSNSNLPAGTYEVTVTDANGCSATTGNIVLNNLTTVTISPATIVDESCGNSNGSIDVTAVGTGSLTYAWSNGETTEDISNLSSGTYDLTITDQSSSCSDNVSYTIANNTINAIVSDTVITDDNCSGGIGAIDITITGAVGTPNYQWNNGAITEDLNNITSGVYAVTITDGTGCSIIESYIVNDLQGGLQLSAVTSDVTCDNSDGAIDLSITGGSTPMTVAWSNGLNSEDIDNLNQGSYTVTVTDINGCEVTDSYIVDAPDEIPVITNSVITNASCATCNDGAINVTVNTFPNTYVWNTGATTQDISFLTPGIYTTTITSVDGCSITESFEILSTASIQNINEINTNLYPNPSSGKITLEGDNVSQATIILFDAQGKQTHINRVNIDTSKVSIDLSHVESGVYILKIFLDGNKKIHRLVIENE